MVRTEPLSFPFVLALQSEGHFIGHLVSLILQCLSFLGQVLNRRLEFQEHVLVVALGSLLLIFQEISFINYEHFLVFIASDCLLLVLLYLEIEVLVLLNLSKESCSLDLVILIELL